MAWTSEGGYEEGYLIVDTTGWPGQSGLLAVKSGFNYWPDPQKGEIHGYFRGRSSINGTGNMIIGSIIELTNIELDVAENQTLSCSIVVVPSDDPAASIWEFICPVNATITEGPFRYPIRVTFRTDQNQNYTSSGELFGYWEQRTVLPKIRYPEEISKILSDSPIVQDLMSDHQVVVVSFNAAADPITGSLDHRWTADVVLLGQAKLDDQILPYSVTIQVEIIDSKLTHWDFDWRFSTFGKLGRANLSSPRCSRFSSTGNAIGRIGVLTLIIYLPSMFGKNPILQIVAAILLSLCVGWFIFTASRWLSQSAARQDLYCRRPFFAEVVSTCLVLAGLFSTVNIIIWRWLNSWTAPYGWDLLYPPLWGALCLGAIAGTLVTYPFHLWMLRRGGFRWGSEATAEEVSVKGKVWYVKVTLVVLSFVIMLGALFLAMQIA